MARQSNEPGRCELTRRELGPHNRRGQLTWHLPTVLCCPEAELWSLGSRCKSRTVLAPRTGHPLGRAVLPGGRAVEPGLTVQIPYCSGSAYGPSARPQQMARYTI